MEFSCSMWKPLSSSQYPGCGSASRMVESEPIESWSASLLWWAKPCRFSGKSLDKSKNSPLWIVVTNEAGKSGVKPPLKDENFSIAGAAAGTELIGSWWPKTSRRLWSSSMLANSTCDWCGNGYWSKDKFLLHDLVLEDCRQEKTRFSMIFSCVNIPLL